MNGDVSAPLSDGGEQQQQQQQQSQSQSQSLSQQQQQQQQQLSNSADGGSQGGGGAHTPNSYSHHGNPLHLFGDTGNSGNGNGNFMLNEFQFDSEMGPVADISTFPPTMAPHPSEDSLGVLTMENILSSGFWDSMLVPGAFGFFFWVSVWV
jgi:hypothetical protein